MSFPIVKFVDKSLLKANKNILGTFYAIVRPCLWNMFRCNSYSSLTWTYEKLSGHFNTINTSRRECRERDNYTPLQNMDFEILYCTSNDCFSRPSSIYFIVSVDIYCCTLSHTVRPSIRWESPARGIRSRQRPLPTQHTTNPRDKYPCPQRDSNPLPQK